jgi:hypothetical protein
VALQLRIPHQRASSFASRQPHPRLWNHVSVSYSPKTVGPRNHESQNVEIENSQIIPGVQICQIPNAPPPPPPSPSIKMSSYSNGTPFPDTFSTRPLSKISFKALAAGSPAEAARLLAAARDTGIFYLDLYAAADGELILEDVDEMFSLAEKLRGIDEEEREYLRSTMKKGDRFGTTSVTQRSVEFRVSQRSNASLL